MVKLFDGTASNGFVQQVVYIYSYIQGWRGVLRGVMLTSKGQYQMPSVKCLLTFVAMLMLSRHACMGLGLVAASTVLKLVQRSPDSALLNCCLILLKQCFVTPINSLLSPSTSFYTIHKSFLLVCTAFLGVSLKCRAGGKITSLVLCVIGWVCHVAVLLGPNFAFDCQWFAPKCWLLLCITPP